MCRIRLHRGTQASVLKKILSLEKFYTNVVGGVGDYYQVCPPSPPPPPTFYKLFKKTNVFFTVGSPLVQMGIVLWQAKWV